MMELKGWVINTRSDDGHGFIGKFWWFGKNPPKIPNHMDGYRTAVFRTRKEAIEGLNFVIGSFHKARVERVTITLTPME